MEKSEMVKKIQKTEAELYLAFTKCKQTFDEDSIYTQMKRNAWFSVAELMIELNITPDFTLPEWKESHAILAETKIIN